MPTDPTRTVVISKIAAITPLGIGYAATKAGLRTGKSAIAEIADVPDVSVATPLHAARIPNFEPEQILGKKGLRGKDRLTLIALSAIQHDIAPELQAIEDNDEIGLICGTTFSGLNSQIEFTARYERGGNRALNAVEFPNMVLNTMPSQINIWFGLTGSSITVTNGFTSGIDAIALAAEQIRDGRCRYIVAGAVDELATAALLAFRDAGFLSPTGRVAPFDVSCDGTVLGEGAALFLLESLASAQTRGATPIAEVLGYGTSFNGTTDAGFTDEGKGIHCAMQLALEDAACDPADIDFVAAAARGNPQGDANEARALGELFGPAERTNIPVVAYNAYWGDCFAASPALNTVAALADLRDGVISGTVNYTTNVHGLAVTTAPLTDRAPQTVLVNACGYTGNNSALVLRTYTQQ